MAMAQPGKAAPSALFGQHRREQIERMHGCQQRQQVDAPELGRAQLPARAAHRASAPMLVDEVVGNVRIQDVEQSARAGHRKAVHAAKGYPFGNDAPGFCWNSQFFNPSGARTVTYAETCNTLSKSCGRPTGWQMGFTAKARVPSSGYKSKTCCLLPEKFYQAQGSLERTRHPERTVPTPYNWKRRRR